MTRPTRCSYCGRVRALADLTEQGEDWVCADVEGCEAYLEAVAPSSLRRAEVPTEHPREVAFGPGGRRVQRVTVHLLPDQADLLARSAEQRGLSRSEVVRQLIDDHLGQ